MPERLHLKGVLELETIWRGLTRHDVFPITWRTMLGFIWRRDFLISHEGLRKLLEDHLPYRNLQDAQLPVHIVTTDIVTGESVVISEGSAIEAIVASTSIPGAFAPVPYRGRYLADGAISANTPIKVAVAKGRAPPHHPADRLCLRLRRATGGGGRQCAPRVDASDRPANGE